MEPNPDPSVDDAFRAALPKLKGKLQVGVIHSIGFRKDAKALNAVSKLISDSDPEVAGAAAASVGMIGGLQAGNVLETALKSTDPRVFPVVARACLLCAEGLMVSNRARALELYTGLSSKSMPEPVRLAALPELRRARPLPIRRNGRRRPARQRTPTRAAFWGAPPGDDRAVGVPTE